MCGQPYGNDEAGAVRSRAGGPAADRRRPASAWRATMEVRLERVEAELTRLECGAGPAGWDECRRRATVENVRTAVDSARRWAGLDDRGRRIGRGLLKPLQCVTGAAVSGAHRSLHNAECELAYLLPDEEIEVRTPELLVALGRCVDADDPRLGRARAALAVIEPPPTSTSVRDDGTAVTTSVELNGRPIGEERRRSHGPSMVQPAFVHYTRTMYDLKDDEHEKVRHLRNVIVVAALAALVLVVVLCVWAWAVPNQFGLCFAPDTAGSEAGSEVDNDPACPSGGRDPAPSDVTVVAFLGVLGAALSWAAFVTKLPDRRTPYGLPLALSILKLPLGALVAVVGMLIVAGGFLPGLSRLDTPAQILGYAVVFGAAQQVVTRLIDRQAGALTDSLPINEGAGDVHDARPAASTDGTGSSRPRSADGSAVDRVDMAVTFSGRPDRAARNPSDGS